MPYDDAKPAAAVAVQSFGDFQNFHPHLHVLATDGCFYNEGAFLVCPLPDSAELEELFRYEVFKLLKAEGKINEPAGGQIGSARRRLVYRGNGCVFSLEIIIVKKQKFKLQIPNKSQ